MNKKWCVREDVFDRENGLWWLNKDLDASNSKEQTTMSVALTKGNISRVVDVKLGGFSPSVPKRGMSR